MLHIRDIDDITSIDEIKEAVHKSMGVEMQHIDARALRPAKGGRQNATVILPADAADKLVVLGKIKIGLVRCRISEREKEIKCYRCWENGHTRKDCTGPDRSNMCMKCGKEGHKAASCTNTPACVYCGTQGHQSGGRKCPHSKKDRELSPLHTHGP